MSHFQQNEVPAMLFSTIPGKVTNNEAFIDYSDDLKKEHFISLMSSHNSVIKQIVYFIVNTLDKGISTSECQSAKNFFAATIQQAEKKYQHQVSLRDVFNLTFEDFNIPDISIIDDADRISVNESNIEKIIQVIQMNRSKEMNPEEVMLERILNVFLLQAFSTIIV